MKFIWIQLLKQQFERQMSGTYIYKDKFLWKKNNDLMPKDKKTIPYIEKHDLEKLRLFNRLTKIDDEYDWADWWVWRYFFNDEIDLSLEIVREDYGFTDKFAESIGYDPKKHTTKGINIDKTIENTIIFNYKKNNAYNAYRIIEAYIVQRVISDYVMMDTKVKIRDSLDFYKLIRKKEKIEITLLNKDYLQIRNICIGFE
uniref:Uncharacterized protein n=1 Tax=Oxytricha trifallax TaxID=1172189 RepID=G9HRB3_9SPIT|nr:hypothetical protein [Oxytricha trifallax]